MSGRKSNIQTYHILNAQSLASSFTSAPTSVLNQDNVAIQLNCTGTPTGTFSIEVSSDYNADRVSAGSPTINAGTWIALTLSGTPTLAGSADQIFIDINQLPAPWFRIRYTATSGSGSCEGYITTKML